MSMQPSESGSLRQAIHQTLVTSGNGQSFGAAIPSSTPYPLNVRGPGGLFSSPCIRTPVFSAYSLPVGGLLERVPIMDSQIAEQLVQYITGIGEIAGTAPVGVCDDLQTAGFIYACRQYHAFGWLGYATEVLNLARLALQARCETSPLPVAGGLTGGNFGPSFGITPTSMLDNNANTQLFTLRAQFIRKLSQWLFSGNPADATAQGGQVPFKGLALQIKTGYTDVEGVACPALDSYVRDLDVDIATNAQVVIDAIRDMYHTSKIRGAMSNLDPVGRVLVMHPNFFYELTKIWPCAYMTDTCGSIYTDAADARVSNASDLVEMRDDMRRNSFLMIDGDRVPVIQDYAVPFSVVTPNTVFEHEVYLLPETVIGGVPATVLEMLNFDGAISAASRIAPAGAFMTSDNGRFLLAKKYPNNLCMQMNAYVSPRLMVLAPHLAGRITGLRTTPTSIYPAAFPGQVGYVNGGIQSI